MSNQAETYTKSFDIVKQVASAILVAAGLFAFYQFSDVKLVYRILGLIAECVVVFYILSKTALGVEVSSFMVDSKIEMRKVVWPTRDETTRTTLLVFAMVTAVSLTLWLLDAFLFWGVRLLTGQV